MLENTKKSIAQTLAFFDLHEYVLTLDELWQWLYVGEQIVNDKLVQSANRRQEINKEEFLESLHSLCVGGLIAEKDGYYFFSERSDFIKTRLERKEISLRKIIKAKKIVNNWLRHIPWIRGVLLTNSLAYFNASENSDIDLLIVGQKNRLWLTRLLAVLPLKILNLRPTLNNKKDKFCLSYFVSEDNLNLEKYEAQNEFAILVYWAAFYWPILAKENLWAEFKKNNNWLKKYLPNVELGGGEFIERVKNFKRIKASRFGDWLEKVVKKFQLWYLPDDLKKNMNLDGGVIVDDKIIKLHNTSQRKEVYKQWQEKVKNI